MFERAFLNVELSRTTYVITCKTLHSVEDMSTGDIITELIARGFDPQASIAEQLQAERATVDDGKVIPITARRNAGKARRRAG